jgi:hypothetical protein
MERECPAGVRIAWCVACQESGRVSLNAELACDLAKPAARAALGYDSGHARARLSACCGQQAKELASFAVDVAPDAQASAAESKGSSIFGQAPDFAATAARPYPATRTGEEKSWVREAAPPSRRPARVEAGLRLVAPN